MYKDIIISVWVRKKVKINRLAIQNLIFLGINSTSLNKTQYGFF